MNLNINKYINTPMIINGKFNQCLYEIMSNFNP